MKKIILPVCLVALSTLAAKAQSFSVGVRGGINFSSISESGGSGGSYGTRTGFLLGGYTSIMFSSKMGIQPELFYSSAGATASDPTVGAITYKVDYISLPVFFRYNFNDMFHVLAGPQFSILASSKATAQGTTIDWQDYTSSSDVSAVLGLGGDFGPFNAGLRYCAGLTNVEKNSGGATATNSVIQIVAGYKFLGK